MLVVTVNDTHQGYSDTPRVTVTHIKSNSNSNTSDIHQGNNDIHQGQVTVTHIKGNSDTHQE